MKFETVEQKWQAAGWVAIGLTLLIAVYHFVAPVPSAGLAAKQHRREELSLRSETKDLLAEISKSRASIEGRLWNVGRDQIGARAMARVDEFAVKEQVKVQAFRPQRTVETPEIIRYPYSVVVQGSFPKVVKFVRRIQDPGTKLALTSVQITAADGETDTVTATIGLAAFLKTSRENQDVK